MFQIIKYTNCHRYRAPSVVHFKMFFRSHALIDHVTKGDLGESNFFCYSFKRNLFSLKLISLSIYLRIEAKIISFFKRNLITL